MSSKAICCSSKRKLQTIFFWSTDLDTGFPLSHGACAWNFFYETQSISRMLPVINLIWLNRLRKIATKKEENKRNENECMYLNKSILLPQLIYTFIYIYLSIYINLVGRNERKLRIIITDVVIYLMKHLTNLRVSEQYLYLYIYTIL